MRSAVGRLAGQPPLGLGPGGLAVSPQSADRVLIGWRRGGGWSTFAYVDEEFGHVDPEDVLWWLLNRGANLESVRPALAAAYPDFDPRTEIGHVTMPDRTEQRAKDKRRRLAARAEFERARHQR